ncbi:DNA-binding protein [Campylobacter fetus subsp. testudinum]|uniref:Mor transcription activator family protein n=1 Tax=Campylobacter fetus TaxID=196 RepID=UPI000CFDDE7C|nr:Mor transcription activator family protein [Campylobacter fetus]AVK80636.1 DNA-binding protein [Campylobacter fetus subsp. testudinum]
MLSNNDIFDEFFERVKSNTKEEILREYGGSAIYIPSYKTTARNDDMQREFQTLISNGISRHKAYRSLSYKYGLSVMRVRKIVDV